MLTDSAQQLAAILTIPDFFDHDDKVPARFCPWVGRCRPGQFWTYPEDTVCGIPTTDLDMLELLVRIQPKTREASDARFEKLLRCVTECSHSNICDYQHTVENLIKTGRQPSMNKRQHLAQPQKHRSQAESMTP